MKRTWHHIKRTESKRTVSVNDTFWMKMNVHSPHQPQVWLNFNFPIPYRGPGTGTFQSSFDHKFYFQVKRLMFCSLLAVCLWLRLHLQEEKKQSSEITSQWIALHANLQSKSYLFYQSNPRYRFPQWWCINKMIKNIFCFWTVRNSENKWSVKRE